MPKFCKIENCGKRLGKGNVSGLCGVCRNTECPCANAPCPNSTLLGSRTGLCADCYTAKRMADIDRKNKRRYYLFGEKQRQVQREKRAAKTKAEKKNEHYRSKFGVSYDWALTLLWLQGCKCAMCDTQLTDLGRAPLGVLDHCHETGKVRGVLCARCNASLGHYESVAEAAERYLRSRAA